MNNRIDQFVSGVDKNGSTLLLKEIYEKYNANRNISSLYIESKNLLVFGEDFNDPVKKSRNAIITFVNVKNFEIAGNQF